MDTVHPIGNNNNDEIVETMKWDKFLHWYCCKKRRFNNASLDIDFVTRLLSSLIRADLVYGKPEYINAIFDKALANDEAGLENVKIDETFGEDNTIDIKKRHFNELKGVKTQPIFLNDDKTDAQGYMWIKDDKVYITFRGTTSIKDCLADANIKLYDWKNKIKIQSGFWVQFTALESKITKELKNNSNYNNIKTIILAGHSLGAAIAQVAAAYYADLFPDKKIISHVCGSPRVGNIDFKNFIESHIHESIRVANQSDPIAAINAVWGAIHASKCLLLFQNKSFKLIDADPWYARIKTFWENARMDLLGEHATSIYVERLEYIINTLKKP